MNCVKCDEQIVRLDEPCPHCRFYGDPAVIEELVHVHWLLSQIGALRKIGVRTLFLEQHYRGRLRQLQVQLGLRAATLTPEQTRDLWMARLQAQAQLAKIDEWSAAGRLQAPATQAVLAAKRQSVRDLAIQLDDRAPSRSVQPAPQRADAARRAVVESLLALTHELDARGAFASEAARDKALAPLLAEQATFEQAAGPRQPAHPAAVPPQPIVRADRGPEAAHEPAFPARPAPAAAALPLRDRFWRTLLSERTLQAMLFLGIFLLFSAALSFVFWGWKDFSAPLRVAIPSLFTLAFLALGWYVRMRTRMYRSGIALTVIAALLIPIDFYTLYVNFNVPPEHTPAFWLITSLVCLAAYVAITLLTASPLFGYLVGVAAGSAVLSLVEVGHQHAALARDWDAAALSAFAVVLVALAAASGRAQTASRWPVLAEPFRALALVAAGAIMLLSFGVRAIDRKAVDALHYSATISWWLGGLVFGWGAVHYRSRTLGLLAALALPAAMLMAQAAVFDRFHISSAWHALGLALLVPIYLTAGYRLRAHGEDPVLYGHGRTAVGWGIALTIGAALWSLTTVTGAAAASTHALLGAAMVWALYLWRNPRLVYAAALFALTATALTMAEANLAPNQFAVGWASWSIVAILLAVANGTRARPWLGDRLTETLVNVGFVIAALATVTAWLPYDGSVFAYALGNWLALSAWSARLAHLGRPGFARGGSWRSRFHWMAALPLPAWVWVVFANRGPLHAGLPLALSALAWGMVALSYRLPGIAAAAPATRPRQFIARFLLSYRLPWYWTGLIAGVAAPLVAMGVARDGMAPPLCLLAAGLLYALDALVNGRRWQLLLAVWATAWGWAWLLDRAGVQFDAVTCGVALLVALYAGLALWNERRNPPPIDQRMAAPLVWASHVLAAVILLRTVNSPLVALIYGRAWTDEMRLWAAASLLALGVVYAVYAWSTLKERWAHAAAWLFAGAGGLIAISFSTGSGSLAARVALVAAAYVLAERALVRLSARELFGQAWQLWHRPLLVAGWVASVAVVDLALIRNLVLLGAGRTQQIWAVVGLVLVIALYALAARLFRQARFVWFAAFLAFIPWTILTNLGWFVAGRPRTAAFAASWMALAWCAYLSSSAIRRWAPTAYAFPLRVLAHSLVPLSLVWGLSDTGTSRITFVLAIALYAVEAIHDARLVARGTVPASRRRAVFLYPALALVPLACLYWLNLLPGARPEHYGIMLSALAAVGIVFGRWLARVAPHSELRGAYALPAYIAGYGAGLVGALLTTRLPGLFALVLLYDALLLLASAWLFKRPHWAYAAAATAPLSYWIALSQAHVPWNRQGWWFLALAAVYLLLAWTLRRARLAPYGAAPLALAFVLIAFTLPPSSGDRVGAFWGYGGAAVLCGITACWLRRPPLLAAACALALVTYSVGVLESGVAREYFGLSLFPGAIVALGIGWLLDSRLGAHRNFPWGATREWAGALVERWRDWWALPLYAVGFGMAAASLFVTDSRAGPAALNALLAMPLGVWAIYRFRLRGWLAATAVAGHCAALWYLSDLGWSHAPAALALRFLPITVLTAGLALVIERRRRETPPLVVRPQLLPGWSHVLYVLVLLDMALVQYAGFSNASNGLWISLVHALLIAAFASLWRTRFLPYASTVLALTALVQWMTTQPGPSTNVPVPLAQLALAYGLAGYGLTLLRERRGLADWLVVWETALRRSGLALSVATLAIAAPLGIDLSRWTARALLGLPFRAIVDRVAVQMIVSVLALLGLLYLGAAVVERRLRTGYASIAMLLVGWMLHAFYVQEWAGATNVQWYALPAGLYLLGVSFLESGRGNRNLARWIDYAAAVLLLGSLFWQTLLFGWTYALLLGAEGFAAFWWGSARRLRRFLYAGLMGVILATVATLVNSLQSINQWLVFGAVGLVLVLAALVVERKMESLKALRQILETWE